MYPECALKLNGLDTFTRTNKLFINLMLFCNTLLIVDCGSSCTFEVVVVAKQLLYSSTQYYTLIKSFSGANLY